LILVSNYIHKHHSCSEANFYFTERKAAGIVIPYVQFITLFSTFYLGLDLPKCLFFQTLQIKFCVYFNFSSGFHLSHLSNCLSVHHPPSFSDQYKPCSSSVYHFIHPRANPSFFTPNISFNPCSSSIFRVQSCGTQTHTNYRHFILCDR